ncbi:hypothetical protein RQP53_21845 [Paucibacter sp. APW11]|uniref:Uncharacterized protein n=1 Tax=Roseateles aquae TaxID=3077235 RepID=A0ABU3PH91_9BURK|nr:hypothetical protein [Paucibacter sp. APW11]MDT9001935.1 hypothetical protein [Paucibacter sp. APW11]
MRFAPSLRFFRRSSATGNAQDPADMGTAFGMEASLENEDSFFRVHSGPGELESEQSRPAAKPGESPLAWMSRRN